jgi:hypothetical protein
MWRRFDNAFRTSSAGRWFDSLQPNERTMVTSLVVFLVVVLL